MVNNEELQTYNVVKMKNFKHSQDACLVFAAYRFCSKPLSFYLSLKKKKKKKKKKKQKEVATVSSFPLMFNLVSTLPIWDGVRETPCPRDPCH